MTFPVWKARKSNPVARHFYRRKKEIEIYKAYKSHETELSKS